MSITPEPPLKTCEGRLKHGSILNGNIGLRRVSSQWKSTTDPHVVITDIDMPGGLSGLDLADYIAAYRKGLPVLVTSGRRMIAPGELPGKATFMAKPYNLSQVLDVTGQWAKNSADSAVDVHRTAWRMIAFPVQYLEQSRELGRREMHRAVLHSTPMELAILKPLGNRAHAAAVLEDQLHPVRSFGAEHIDRAREWVSIHLRLHE